MNNFIDKLETIDRNIVALLAAIQQLDVEQLIYAAIYARRVERAAFLIRGLCVVELRKHLKPLPGGIGKRDLSGQGRQAKMKQLAQAAGVDIATLNTDARICQTFFPSGDETTLAREPLLAREFYVIALGAPDPHAAIKIALKQCQDPYYRRERFRAYIRSLKRTEKATSARHEAFAVLRAHVPEEVSHLLSEILEITGKGKDEVVAQAIITLHHQIKAGKSKSVSDFSQTSKRQSTVQDSRQLELGL